MSREHALSPGHPVTLSRTPGIELFRRFLLGAIVALLVARPLVPGDDPGLLYRPWSSAAGLVLTQLWLLTSVGGAAWRLLTGRRVPWGWIDLGLLGLVAFAFVSTVTIAGYKHPAWLITSEWLAILCAFRLVRQLARSAEDQQRLLAVLVASAVSLAANGLFQTFYRETPHAKKNPLPQPGLVHENFEIGPPPLPADLTAPPGAIRATFARPATFAAFLWLLLPAGLGFAAAGWRDRRWSAQTVLAATCVLVIAAPVIAIAVYRQWHVPAGDTLASTWQVIASHPWLGVGPGNFSRHYPRFAVAASESISSPPGFFFDTAASEGIPAFIVLLGILLLLFRKVWSFARNKTSSDPPPAERCQRLEFYVGGMAGLTLGFVLGALSQPPESLHANILRWGMIAGARALIWFAAFGILENMSLPAKTRSVAAAAGVLACLLPLTVASGFSLPTLAQPLWVMVALAVNASQPQEETIAVHWLRAFASLPVTAAVSLSYLLYFLVPMFSCEQTMRAVRREVPGYWQRFDRIEEAKTPQAKKNALQVADRHLREKILVPLQDPVRQDPADVYPIAERVRWLIEQVKLAPVRAADERLEKLFQTARDLDPDGTEVRSLECQVYLLYSQRAKKEQNLEAALKVLDELRTRDPQSPRVRYMLAEVHFLQGNAKDARYQAEQALQLNERCRDQRRQLTPAQRRQLRDRFGLPSAP